MASSLSPSFFFFNDTATTEIYTLSLHDALPISLSVPRSSRIGSPAFKSTTMNKTGHPPRPPQTLDERRKTDRKSTRLNSSHGYISYAVFCLKKKNHKHPR